jgi:dCTP deaminase
MILTDSAILMAMEAKDIVIEPFLRECLGSNSYDVHLSRFLAVYNKPFLDAKEHNKVTHFEIPTEGYVLEPGVLYLGSTQEYTESHKHVPFLDGKSSVGRLGIDIHATAGNGDIGFCNHWTLELSVTLPVRVYEGMPIGQLIFHSVTGECLNPYNKKEGAKYNGRNAKPVESMMFKNFTHEVKVSPRCRDYKIYYYATKMGATSLYFATINAKNLEEALKILYSREKSIVIDAGRTDRELTTDEQTCI